MGAPRPGQQAAQGPAGAAGVAAPKSWLFEQPGATDTVLIGCILPFEGDLRLTGTAVYRALKLAITEQAPKVLSGVNVNLTCINTKCQDIAAHMAMMQLVQEGAVAVVGEVCSAATVAAAGVASTSRTPLISPAATSPALSEADFFFRTVPSDRFQGQAGAALAFRKGFRNIAMVYEDAAYGYGLAFNFIAAFTKDGGNVPVVIPFKKGEGQPQAAVAQLKTDKADKSLDAVFLSTNNLTYAAGFLKAAKAADLGLKIFAGDALSDTGLLGMVKGTPSAIGNLFVTTTNKGKNSFIKRFKAANPGVAYQGFAAQAYDAMTALLRALGAVQPPQRDGLAIAQALQRQKFDGVSGPIQFDKNGDVLPHDRTYMWVKHNTTTGIPDVKGFVAHELLRQNEF